MSDGEVRYTRDGAFVRRGDGVLTTRPPDRDRPDTFSYDPKNPVPSRGGNVCCQGNAVAGGAFEVATCTSVQFYLEPRPADPPFD